MSNWKGDGRDSLLVRCRDEIERRNAAWAGWAASYPRIVLIATLVFTIAAALGLGRLRIETSPESLLKLDDPARVEQANLRALFGTTERVLLLIRNDDIFSQDFLERLGGLHEDLEQSLSFPVKVTSLRNARHVYGRNDELIVEDLIPRRPIRAADLGQIREQAMSNPIYRNALLSEDGGLTAIVIEARPISPPRAASDAPIATDTHGFSGEQDERLVSEIDAVVSRHDAANFSISIVGAKPAAVAIMRALRLDLGRLTVLSALMAAGVLFCVFRRLSAVIVPLLTVGLSLTTTFGLMGYFGVAITPATQIVPPFLMAVGVAAAVHILVLYYRKLDAGSLPQSAIVDAFTHSGLAVAMTSVTTAASLASFMFTDMGVLTNFGISASLGVMVTLFYVSTVLTPLLAWMPTRSRDHDRGVEVTERVSVGLAAIGAVATAHPRAVVSTWTLLLVVAGIGVSGLRFHHQATEWLSADDPLRGAMELATNEIHGGLGYEVLIDTGQAGGLYEPAAIAALDRMRALAESGRLGGLRSGRAVSISDVVKETNRALEGNRRDSFKIPDSRELIAQELLLFEMSGSTDLEDLVDPSYRYARMSVSIPMEEVFLVRSHLKAAQEEFRRLAGEAMEVTVAGQATLDVSALTAMITSMAKSYIIALLALTPLIVLLTGDLRIGLLSMVPNIAPVFLTLGFMHWFSMPLDMFSMMIGAVAIGVAVDDTIHVLHNFRRYFAQSGDVVSAIHASLRSTGPALLFTSVILTGAFLVFTGASMSTVQNFGLIAAMMIVFAFLADITLLPALLVMTLERKGFELTRDLARVRDRPALWGKRRAA